MFPTLLAAAGDTGSSLDASSVIELVKSCMGLFTEFPLNILLTAAVAVVGFKIFKKAKGAAK